MDDDDDGVDAEPGNPMIELGEEMRIPADHATRRSYLETEFQLFERADMRLYHHVNGLFVLFLSRHHPLREHPLRATARLVYTEATRGILKVTGKKRKGAPRTEPNTVIAHVEVEDGTKWGLQAGIKGFVVEINENVTSAALLDSDDPTGFVAILQPKSDFQSLASFVPGMLEEAKERRLKKQKQREESDNRKQQQQKE